MSSSHQGPKFGPVKGQRLEQDTSKPCPLMPWYRQVSLIFHKGKVSIEYTPGQAGWGKKDEPGLHGFHFPSTSNSN